MSAYSWLDILNWAERWALFSDAWAEELRASPSIDYLKMAEAQNLRDQFRNWDADVRNTKAAPHQCNPKLQAYFLPVFDKPGRVQSARQSQFSKAVGQATFRLRFWGDLHACKLLHSTGARVPIDFVFDEQEGVSADVNLFFDEMVKPLSPEARQLINGKPIFRDDKVFLPLQAADMLAWHLRREHEGAPKPLPMANLLRARRASRL